MEDGGELREGVEEGNERGRGRTRQGWSDEEKGGRMWTEEGGSEEEREGEEQGRSEGGREGAIEGGKCHGRYSEEDTGHYTVYSAQNNPQRGPCACA